MVGSPCLGADRQGDGAARLLAPPVGGTLPAEGQEEEWRVSFSARLELGVRPATVAGESPAPNEVGSEQVLNGDEVGPRYQVSQLPNQTPFGQGYQSSGPQNQHFLRACCLSGP